jgi:hypothetical protein
VAAPSNARSACPVAAASAPRAPGDVRPALWAERRGRESADTSADEGAPASNDPQRRAAASCALSRCTTKGQQIYVQAATNRSRRMLCNTFGAINLSCGARLNYVAPAQAHFVCRLGRLQPPLTGLHACLWLPSTQSFLAQASLQYLQVSGFGAHGL